MKDSPSFVGIAALLGDQARATMLSALMGGKALTASELATEANITRQTASSHLSKLVEARLLIVQPQGRHRYFQLAEPDVAAMLESMMGVAHRSRTTRTLAGPRDPTLRKARRCYDHLAGELAVEAYDSFVDRGFMRLTREEDSSDTLALTLDGREFFNTLGIDFAQIDNSRRPICRPCLDWSVRRYHLAGGLGRALLDFCYQMRWAKPVKGSRIVQFKSEGERRFRKCLLV
jgi:DNA-binding transcriptional ArsR family regulator